MDKEIKMTAEETLLKLIDIITVILEDLQDLEAEEPNNEAVKSAKSAYVACLEIISHWEKAEENGLDFDIEEIFPI